MFENFPNYDELTQMLESASPSNEKPKAMPTDPTLIPEPLASRMPELLEMLKSKDIVPEMQAYASRFDADAPTIVTDSP